MHCMIHDTEHLSREMFSWVGNLSSYKLETLSNGDEPPIFIQLHGMERFDRGKLKIFLHLQDDIPP